jgi:membrane protein
MDTPPPKAAPAPGASRANRPGRRLGIRRFVVPRSAWSATWHRAVSDDISLVAAGCAFYAMLAMFPALSLIVSVYGLWFDLNSVEPQLALVSRLLPQDAAILIAQRVRELVTMPRGQLGAGAFISGVVAFWSASAGIRALLGALAIAHGRSDSRSMVNFYATALLFTLGGILAFAIGLGLLVALPRLLGLEGTPIRLLSLLLLYCAVLAFIAMLYRYGPPTPPRGWRMVTPGTLLATSLWAAASALFSAYLRDYASYDAVHGALGGAVVLLTWLYLGVYLILLGAELDAATATSREPPPAA